MDGYSIKFPEPEIVTNFYGVYLLQCVNPKYPGRTYVGYTRDPNRRIMQHNRGTWAGGAHRTNNKGPWKMVLIIHGFPNNIAALRFEWAWQNPGKSTRLQHVEQRKRQPRRESELDFRLRILSEMLRCGPWRRLPLTVRWLDQQSYKPFPMDKEPASHMIIKRGPVKSKNKTKKSKDPTKQSILCSICFHNIYSENSTLKCLNPQCCLYFHIVCLGQTFLEDGEYIPIDGCCPKCDFKMMWGDLIRNIGFGDDDFSCSLRDVSDDDLSQDCCNASGDDDR